MGVAPHTVPDGRGRPSTGGFGAGEGPAADGVDAGADLVGGGLRARGTGAGASGFRGDACGLVGGRHAATRPLSSLRRAARAWRVTGGAVASGAGAAELVAWAERAAA